LGNTDLDISSIGLGTWAYGNDFFGEVEDKKSIKTIRKAVDLGINFIDTAPAYGDGHSEKVVGKAIKDIRDKVVLATKCGTYREGPKYIHDLSPERIRKDIEDSLRRLKVDYIDLYQIHWPVEDTPLKTTVEELLKIKEEGKFKYLGVCNFDSELLNVIAKMTEIVSLQPQYSLLQRDIEEDSIKYVLENNLSVLSYGTLYGGILTGKYKELPSLDDEKDNRDIFYSLFSDQENWRYVQNLLSLMGNIAEKYNKTRAQIAINWAINRPGITTALVGAKDEKQIQQNAAAVDWNLSEIDMTALTEKSNLVLNQIK
jgi:aryl-alcohol dehydrogenase-like predicted oxidoreductase